MEKYLYLVSPRIPIKGVASEAIIRREKNIELTKEEVKTCLKHGPVFRNFMNEGIKVQVNLGNVDRLHNPMFIEEKNFTNTTQEEAPLAPVVDEKPDVVDPEVAPEEEIKEEPSTVNETEEKIKSEEIENVSDVVEPSEEEKKNEEVVEDQKEEAPVAEDDCDIVIEAEEDDTEAVNDEEPVEEIKKENNYNKNNNNNYKKKHK